MCIPFICIGRQIALRVAGNSEAFSGTAKRSSPERIADPKTSNLQIMRQAESIDLLHHPASCKGLVQEANIETKNLENGHVREDVDPKDPNRWPIPRYYSKF
ncbi:hypothetical protein BDFG_08647 [Blastomyces dermatitidis ATCC 26199]|nr:hypothetical protein BDFG_08647 [Blastomyces dermatitidis ATCC 26199]